MKHPSSLIRQTEPEFAENQQIVDKTIVKAEKNWVDYLALALSTCGVGYIKFAPGTWGSLLGVGLYLIWRYLMGGLLHLELINGWRTEQIEAWRIEANILAVLLASAIGIWAANRASLLLNKKDPQQIVVDEVAGQFVALMFIGFNAAWWMILWGFLLFRLFDIWKPYPIDGMQELPGGFGVVVDDLVAGIYAAIVLSLINALIISLN